VKAPAKKKERGFFQRALATVKETVKEAVSQVEDSLDQASKNLFDDINKQANTRRFKDTRGELDLS
jgi:gas vesicle protein